jgi:uncharacterized protein (TIGR03083 family)
MTQSTHEPAASQAPEPVTGQAHVDALRSSVERLRDLAAPMTEQQLPGRAYPTQWTVAQVLSHLGSGAVITQRRLQDALRGQGTPDDFAPGVWDVWNAKSPVAQRDDALAADAALLSRIEAVAPAERDRFTYAMGSTTFGFGQFVGLRLNEHAFHTWDIEVVADPAATIPVPVATLVVDNLDLVARFTGKPTGDTMPITVSTAEPQRRFTIDLTPEAVSFTAGAAGSEADLDLPAEAFSRLVYGRLDAAHSPAGVEGKPEGVLHILRRVFPGP